MATVLERLKKVITEELGVDDESIAPSTSFIDDLNVDSSDLAELITLIEDEFSTPERKLEMPDEAIDRIVTVQDVIEYLRDCGIED